MKLLVLGVGNSDVLSFVKLCSEFPPVAMPKKLHGDVRRVEILYGRCRLRDGFIYLYCPVVDTGSNGGADGYRAFVESSEFDAVLVAEALEEQWLAVLTTSYIVTFVLRRLSGRRQSALERRPRSNVYDVSCDCGDRESVLEVGQLMRATSS